MMNKEENRTFEYHWIPPRIREGWADESGLVSVIERTGEGRGRIVRKPVETLFTRAYSVPAGKDIPEELETFTFEGYASSLEALMGKESSPDWNPFWAAAELVTEMYYKTPGGHGIPGEDGKGGEDWMTLENLVECDRRMPSMMDEIVDLKWAVVHAPENGQFVLADTPLYVGNLLSPETAETERGAFRAPGAFFLTPLTPKTAVLVFDASVYVTYVDDNRNIVLSGEDLFLINRQMMAGSRTIAVGPCGAFPYTLYLLNVINADLTQEDLPPLSFLGINGEVEIPSGDTRPYCRLLDEFREKEIKGKGIEMYTDEADEKETDFIWNWIFTETGITPGGGNTENKGGTTENG